MSDIDRRVVDATASDRRSTDESRRDSGADQISPGATSGDRPAQMTLVRIDARGGVVRSLSESYDSPPPNGQHAAPETDHVLAQPASDADRQSLTAATTVKVPAITPTGPTASPPTNSSANAPANAPAGKPRRRSDSLTQSMVLLATMTIMLLSARFVVPHIVEEVRYAWHRGQLRAEYEVAGDGLKNVSLSALSQAYQMVTSAVGPSVVHLDVSRGSKSSSSGRGQSPNRNDLDFGRGLRGSPFGGGLGSGSIRMPADQGSGVVIDQSGYILTNQHVVKGSGRIVVTLSDGRRRDAVLVGVDELTDLAVIKIDADDLMPIAWGDSDDCRVGTPVWAVGSPFGLDRTVTFGIVSGKHRMLRTNTAYQDFMQSDVAVNPGNSGGPLVDADGQLVGINTAILGDVYQGVSFSIPSNVARRVYQSIRENGSVQRAYLGVGLAQVPDEMLVGENSRRRGALIGNLAPQSPAGRAGVRPGDIVLAFDGKAIDDMQHLQRLVGAETAGNRVELEIIRRGQRERLDVSLGMRPR